jgi:hypothetical protein
VLPGGRVQKIRDLQDGGAVVAKVGDGINVTVPFQGKCLSGIAELSCDALADSRGF